MQINGMEINDFTPLYARYGELMVQRELTENEINRVKTQIQQLLTQLPAKEPPKDPEGPDHQGPKETSEPKK